MTHRRRPGGKKIRTVVPSRRFHRWSGDPYGPLRPWEKRLWFCLYARIPEHRLWASVLVDALQRMYSGTTAAIVEETMRWITASSNTAVGDFAVICANLDIEMADIRASLAEDAGRFPMIPSHGSGSITYRDAEHRRARPLQEMTR